MASHPNPYPPTPEVQLAQIWEQLAALDRLLELRFSAADKALALQAEDYKIHFDRLNHSHERAIAVQNTYVTQSVYDAKIGEIEKARVLALDRMDERFQDHVKRYELRHEELREQMGTFVINEKYELALKAEEEARQLALNRIDEKFNDHVKRYELRQREIDLIIQAQQNASDLIRREADTAANEAKEKASLAAENARFMALAVEKRANRNLAIMALILTFVVAVANLVIPNVG